MCYSIDFHYILWYHSVVKRTSLNRCMIARGNLDLKQSCTYIFFFLYAERRKERGTSN
nr:MAG TPA: hypothetical protein [Caudoviricetes sp.]